MSTVFNDQRAARELARRQSPLDAAEPLPPERDAADLAALARWMDSAFRIPGLGVKFGLDAIIGLIPGLGDAATSLVSLYILAQARQLGVGRATLARIALNIAIDVIVGAVPLVGDVFDIYWKSNQRNVALTSAARPCIADRGCQAANSRSTVRRRGNSYSRRRCWSPAWSRHTTLSPGWRRRSVTRCVNS